MKTYVMSDIHGRYDLFAKMLEEIQFSNEDVLYILGDVVDRGPKPIELLEHIMNHPNIHLCMGNHEEYLIDRIRTYGYDGTVYDNGMSHETIRRMRRLPHKKRFKILTFLKSLPYHFDIVVNEQRIVLVHAGINHIEPGLSDKDFMIWAKEEFISEGPDYPFLIIHGHTPVQFMVDQNYKRIHKYRNRINIDCGAPFIGGVLACLRLEDSKEFYME